MENTATTSETKEQKGMSPAPFAHDDIHLIHVTSQAIIQRTWVNSREEWGKAFEAEVYYSRERFLSSLDFAINGQQKCWVLVPKTFDPEHPDLDHILSALETYERSGIIATKEQGLRDVCSVSIASVFTPANYRGHGYASLMMKLLWEELQKMDKVQFTFLYSDVGPKFYSRFGWTADRSDEIVIPATHSLVFPASSSTSVTLQDVTENQLTELATKDIQLLRESLQEQAESSNADTVYVAVTPEPTCISWLNARSRFTAQNLKLSQDGPTVLGVKDTQTNSFVFWFHEFVYSTLFIIRWRVDPKAEDGIASALLQAALAEAKRWKLQKVVIWNPDQSVVNASGLEATKRDESISSIGFVSPGYESKHVKWELNEKYAW
ncbi:hypothetical protein BGZ49_002902 [Haplosporangium sp. Z 27]|nr:hypothetical protein BGZ49_002902 [Haplosporangium sp. Z 27]